jgi:hypothetical protein
VTGAERRHRPAASKVARQQHLGWVQQFEFFVTITAALIKQVATLTTPPANSGTRDEREKQSALPAREKKRAAARRAPNLFF